MWYFCSSHQSIVAWALRGGHSRCMRLHCIQDPPASRKRVEQAVGRACWGGPTAGSDPHRSLLPSYPCACPSYLVIRQLQLVLAVGHLALVWLQACPPGSLLRTRGQLGLLLRRLLSHCSFPALRGLHPSAHSHPDLHLAAALVLKIDTRLRQQGSGATNGYQAISHWTLGAAYSEATPHGAKPFGKC
jgi:hypothetical protein